jgi:hypothetical protein
MQPFLYNLLDHCQKRQIECSQSIAKCHRTGVDSPINLQTTYWRRSKSQLKWKNALKLLPQETVLSAGEFKALLDTYLPKLGSQHRTGTIEAAAIAFYHQQTDWPVPANSGL